MLEHTTRIYVRDPDREDNLIPAVVVETTGKQVMLRFLQAVSMTAGAQTQLLFHNQDNCFTKIECQFQRMYSTGPYPNGGLILTGEPEVAESRSSFRIGVFDDMLTALVNDDENAEVINISCGGLGLILVSEDHLIDKWVSVKLTYDCEEYNCPMQVRSVLQQDDGRFRYGVMADADDTNSIALLTRITQQLQQIKARRASRIGVNNKAKNSESNDQDGGSADKQQTSDKPAESPDGTKRIHLRNAWPGMAKVYIREENNLRVLDVDTVDLSQGGMSFISPQYVYKGSEMLFEKPITGGFFRVLAVARNVRFERIGVHRVGAQFKGSPLKPGEILPDFDPNLHAA